MTAAARASRSSSSPGCPAPAAARRRSAWRTSAGSSSTTCRRRCSSTMVDLGARSQGAVSTRSRWSSTCASAPSPPTCTPRSTSWSGAACTARVVFLEASDEALVRRFESVRRPHPLQGDGRLVDGIAARARSCCATCAATPTWSSTPSLLNVHELRGKVDAAFGGEAGHGALHVDGGVLRLQVRPAGRRRPRRRLPVPAQPALGARSCGRMTGRDAGRARLRPRPGRRGGVPRRATRACSSSSPRATCARASATRRSPSAAPAASTAASPWPSSWPRGCGPRRHRGHRCTHRDLGRE